MDGLGAQRIDGAAMGLDDDRLFERRVIHGPQRRCHVGCKCEAGDGDRCRERGCTKHRSRPPLWVEHGASLSIVGVKPHGRPSAPRPSRRRPLTTDSTPRLAAVDEALGDAPVKEPTLAPRARAGVTRRYAAQIRNRGVLTSAEALAQQSGIPSSNLTLINEETTYAHNDPAGAYPNNEFFNNLVPFLDGIGK